MIYTNSRVRVLPIWSPCSGTSRVNRRKLFRVRVLAFEKRIVSQPHWARFAIWGAGRDGHMFFSELSPQAKSKVIAFLDVDPEKYGEVYINHHHINPVAIPVLGRDEISALFSAEKSFVGGDYSRVPIVACVAKRQKGCRHLGELEKNLSLMSLIEGESLWYMC